MKRHLRIALTAMGVLALSAFLFLSGNFKALADVEFDMNDLSAQPSPTPTQPAAQPTVQPTAVPSIPAATATPVPTTAPLSGDSQEETTIEAGDAAPTPLVGQGVVKARDYYDAGIKYYKEKDYDRAIVFLKKAAAKQDPYTPKYIYAETNAMLGVIYQFHIIHYGRAYRYYRAALKYEADNPTARRHLREVYKYRHEKD